MILLNKRCFMKKVRIFINLALIFIIAAAIVSFATTINWCSNEWYLYSIDRLNNTTYAEISLRNAVVYTIIDTFSLITAILGAAMLVILNPDFFRISRLKNFYGELAERRAENKTARAERKAAKNAEQKQARIAELEKELNELKKDE